jgi:DNA-binding XRE family transcriptional regulator
MRKKINIPRILKIIRIEELMITVIFNNGESRIIDFKNVLQKTGIKSDSPAGILYNPEEFANAEIQNDTLSWNNVKQFITLKSGKKTQVPFEIGADVLLKFSEPEITDSNVKIGKLIRDAREKSGLTQQDLAIMSGTSRSYISRIENNRSDIEIGTLRKIIETGLGKQLEIDIK